MWTPRLSYQPYVHALLGNVSLEAKRTEKSSLEVFYQLHAHFMPIEQVYDVLLSGNNLL